MKLSCLDCEGTGQRGNGKCPFCVDGYRNEEGVTVIKRSARKARTVEINFDDDVMVMRRFTFKLPESFGFDHEDTDDIERGLEEMKPSPDEIQMPVPSGMGDLVADWFCVTFYDDKRSDDEIRAAITRAVRSSLRAREWRDYGNGHLVHIV